jgi:serine/threonine protein kinase/Tol biopolymer transport system component
MSLSSGSRLGPYEIVAAIGAGGMGEVYRARDTRLARDVAIKVLPDHHAATSEVRARFEREARTVSSLNHPHICTLHDVGREGDTDYLVMELVEGESLAQRLARGPLPVAEVLKLAAQIADALDRAHRAGVIHRDLKPGNVMLTRAGAKLLDFGLARATGLDGPVSESGATRVALTRSPTRAAPLTAEGTIVGTFQYMAPEQLEGGEADARSDLWSFGCVLYEMTTGKRAFDGATQASLISAIMRDQPRSIAELAPMSPPGLERLVRQCLEKDPDERWQSAGDVRRELEWIAAGSSAAGMPAVTARRRGVPAGMIGLAGGALIALSAIVLSLGPWRERPSSLPLVRFTLTSPPGTVLVNPAEAEISPDGRMLVFVAADSEGTRHLFTRPLGRPEARALPGTANATLPFWSPDGRLIGFFKDEKLEKIGLDGNPPVDLCDAPDPRGGSWSPSGVIVFAPNNQGGLVRVSANGGATTPVTQIDTTRHERGHRYPQFLPDGRHFLYVAIAAEEEVTTFAGSLDGGKPTELVRGGSMARYSSSGYLLVLDGGVTAPRRRLLARRFDSARLRVSGDAELVLDPVSANNFGYANVTSGVNGLLVAQHWDSPHQRVTWRDRGGAVTGVAIEDFAGGATKLSPDGGRLAYGGEDPYDLFVRDMSTGVSTRVTFENQQVGSIYWSPDGRRIAFARLSGARGWEARVKAADGSGPDSLVFHGPGLFTYPQDWSSDGRWLVVTCADPSGNFDLWRVPMDGSGHPEIYQKTPAQERTASISQDGHWIAYAADEGSKRSLYVQSFPEPGTKYQVAVDDLAGGGWNRSGDALIVGNVRGELMQIQVSTENGFRQGATTRLFRIPAKENLLDVEPGGQRFLCGAPQDVAQSNRLEVVLGWPALLEKP